MNDFSTTQWKKLIVSSPWYLFVPQDTKLDSEYSHFRRVNDIFQINTVGFYTGQDKETFGFTQAEAIELAIKHKLSENVVTRSLYRTFDFRYLVYDQKVVVRPRFAVLANIANVSNIALLTNRQTHIEFRHILATDSIGDLHVFETAHASLYELPLYLYPIANGARRQASLFDDDSAGSAGPGGRRANLSVAFISEITAKLGVSWIADGRGDLVQTIGPEDMFHYAYAVLHSSTYRTRYAEFLKIDFPRLPLTSDINLFAALAAKGAALVDLHLLRLPDAGGVGGNGGAAILQSPGKQGVSYPQGGSNSVEKITYDAAQGRVAINTDQYFAGVGSETWAMRVGGYQPLDKWLKDRKGRVLSSDDVLHYMRVIIALRET